MTSPTKDQRIEADGEATFLDGRVTLHKGDCLQVLASMPENSVDAVVTDPPYHLTSIVKRFGADGAAEAKEGATGAFKRASAGFMGKQWDGGDIAFQVETWRAVLRVLKPGGYVLAFASTRGFGRMSVAIEDAGFIQHPLIDYLFESRPEVRRFMRSLSFPQLEAFVRLVDQCDGGMLHWIFGSGFPKATRVKADGYDGHRYGGQALKPAIEPIFMGQKPFEKGLSGTENILKWGTGALWIDGCRIGETGARNNGRKVDSDIYGKMGSIERVDYGKGRWPANVVHDGSDEVLAAFPATTVSGSNDKRGGCKFFMDGDKRATPAGAAKSEAGSAARFFYSSKADAEDRIGSKHPTVKPIDLMRYLVRLVTPAKGTVLDPFAGTGTTGEAAWREGLNAVLIEREPEYQADIAERMRLCLAGPEERKREILKRRGLAEENAGPLFAGDAA